MCVCVCFKVCLEKSMWLEKNICGLWGEGAWRVWGAVLSLSYPFRRECNRNDGNRTGIFSQKAKRGRCLSFDRAVSWVNRALSSGRTVGRRGWDQSRGSVVTCTAGNCQQRSRLCFVGGTQCSNHAFLSFFFFLFSFLLFLACVPSFSHSVHLHPTYL